MSNIIISFFSTAIEPNIQLTKFLELNPKWPITNFIHELMFVLDENKQSHIEGFEIICNHYKNDLLINKHFDNEYLLYTYLRTCPKSINIIKIFVEFKILNDYCLVDFPVLHYHNNINDAIKIIQYLIDSGSCIDKVYNNGLTTLHKWVRGGFDEKFIKLAITPKSINSIFNGETPLLRAIRTKRIDTIKLLISFGANVNCKSTIADAHYNNCTPLDYAIGNNEIIKCLLSAGANYKLISRDAYYKSLILEQFVELRNEELEFKNQEIELHKKLHKLEIEGMHDSMCPGKNFLKSFKKEFGKKPDQEFINVYSQYLAEHLNYYSDSDDE